MTNSTTETGASEVHVRITIVGPHRVKELGALLYSNVQVYEQWESDEKVAIIWTRPDFTQVEYQSDRLKASGLWTFPLWEGLPELVEAMGLNVPCVDNQEVC